MHSWFIGDKPLNADQPRKHTQPFIGAKNEKVPWLSVLFMQLGMRLYFESRGAQSKTKGEPAASALAHPLTKSSPSGRVWLSSNVPVWRPGDFSVHWAAAFRNKPSLRANQSASGSAASHSRIPDCRQNTPLTLASITQTPLAYPTGPQALSVHNRHVFRHLQQSLEVATTIELRNAFWNCGFCKSCEIFVVGLIYRMFWKYRSR